MEDGRWQCRRGQNDGGPCEKGPLPDGQCCQKLEACSPTPSLRTRRKRVALWASAFCVGLIALAVGSERAGHFLMPGPLSSPHASQTDCKSCHGGVESNDLGWLHSLAVSASPQENAKLCTGCHNVGSDPLSPHTHPVDKLRQLTAQFGEDGHEIQNASLSHLVTLPVPNKDPVSGQETIFCATCHQEHQGTFFDQTMVSNQRCQTCHTSKFGSFSDSHPEFSDYPFNRRTRIIFNHKSHFGKHFPKILETDSTDKDVPEVCADCHRPGAGQKYMEIRGYAPMCSSCHDGDIFGTTRASGPKGIDFLAVPGLDVVTLEERGIDIGDWPEDSEAELTAFVRALIAAEPEGPQLIQSISELDLLDLSDADETDLANVKALAWSVKRLLRRFENVQLSEAIMSMPANKDGSHIDHLQMARLTGTMSHDVIMSGNREWFPNLKDDLAKFKSNEPTKSFTALKANTEDDSTEPAQPSQGEPTSQESLDSNDNQDGSLELDDEGAGLLEDDNETDGADLESASDLEGSDTLEDTTGLEESDGLEETVGLEEDNGSLDDEGPGLLETGDDTSLSDDDALASDDGILDSGDDSGDLELTGDDESEGGLQSETAGLETDSDETSEETEVKPFDPEVWAEFGGWYRQDFSIRYRPTGHSDRFLRTWIDYSGHAFGGEQEKLLAPVFDALAGKDALGRCGKCHSVDNEDGTRHFKWRAFSTSRVKNRFTTFSHEPHISASGSKGCVMCHELSTAKADYMKTYDGRLPGIFAPNFKPLEKATCSGCHSEQTAGETCTLCHNYHATEFSRPLVKTKLPK